MDTTALLVRETAQNSWDARSAQADQLRFSMHIRSLDDREQELLREVILPGNPPGLSRVRPRSFQDVLNDVPLSVLEIHDRGSVGLGGPIRSDSTVPQGTSCDFIDLVLRVGSPRDIHLGGGTYGFGKTVAYIASLLGTVVIYTNTVNSGVDPPQRLIASAIGESFDRAGFAYTGRHWWGRIVDDNIEPAVGRDAEDIAATVFSEIPTAGDPGTSLMILAPDVDGMAHPEWASKAAEAVLWHLWPKLLPDAGTPAPMTISLRCDGRDIEIPDPSMHPVLQGYSASLQAIRDVQAKRTTPEDALAGRMVIVDEITRYSEVVGHLGFTIRPYSPSDGGQPEVTGFQGPSHHVALMRHEAELVVEYLALVPLESQDLQWHGVFKPVEAVDDAFAAAEPPAHNRWEVPHVGADSGEPNLTRARRDASRVRIALGSIRDLVRKHVSQPATVDPDAAGGATGLARTLGSLLVPSAEDPGPPRRERRSRRRPVNLEVTARRPRLLPDGWVIRVLAVDLPVIHREAVLTTSVAVGFDGGSERGDAARRVRYLDDGGREVGDGPDLRLGPGSPQRWSVEIETPPGVAVDVSIDIQDVQ